MNGGENLEGIEACEWRPKKQLETNRQNKWRQENWRQQTNIWTSTEANTILEAEYKEQP